MASTRLKKELKELITTPLEGCTVQLINDNILDWKATIAGPVNTPYEGGSFDISLTFNCNYPFNPPANISFMTKIFHPNVDSQGKICTGMIHSTWNPATKISQALLLVMSFLVNPNPDDPLNHDAVELFKADREKFNETAKEWTKMHAM